MRKSDKKLELQKNINYKNLIAQYYDKDPHLTDVKSMVKSVTPDIQIFDELNSFEKHLDNLIKTKRYDIQEMFMKPHNKVKKLLRIYFTREKIEDSTIIKIYGHLYPHKQETKNTKFTSFFKQISFGHVSQVQFLQTWRKPTSNFQQRDGIVFKLPENDDEAIKISLWPINNPVKFQVDTALQKIVGIKKGTRVEVLQAFWLYVKNMKLQDNENKQIINADDNIRNVFKIEKLTFATINNRIRQHLSPVDPIIVQLSSTNNKKAFDLIVELEERINVDIVPFFSQRLNEQKNDHPFLALNSKLKKLQKKFQEHTEKLRRHIAKKRIYENFQTDSIESLIRQQHELLKELRSKTPIDEYNRLEFILDNEDEVEKQIKHYFEQVNVGTTFAGRQNQ